MALQLGLSDEQHVEVPPEYTAIEASAFAGNQVTTKSSRGFQTQGCRCRRRRRRRRSPTSYWRQCCHPPLHAHAVSSSCSSNRYLLHVPTNRQNVRPFCVLHSGLSTNNKRLLSVHGTNVMFVGYKSDEPAHEFPINSIEARAREEPPSDGPQPWNGAFQGCTGLASIDFPVAQEIGGRAFEGEIAKPKAPT